MKKSIGCDIPALKNLMFCEDLPERDRKWKGFIGKGYSATFNFEPISQYLGQLTLRLSEGDTIYTDGERIIIEYTDGIKHTINKSWF